MTVLPVTLMCVRAMLVDERPRFQLLLGRRSGASQAIFVSGSASGGADAELLAFETGSSRRMSSIIIGTRASSSATRTRHLGLPSVMIDPPVKATWLVLLIRSPTLKVVDPYRKPESSHPAAPLSPTSKHDSGAFFTITRNHPRSCSR